MEKIHLLVYSAGDALLLLVTFIIRAERPSALPLTQFLVLYAARAAFSYSAALAQSSSLAKFPLSPGGSKNASLAEAGFERKGMR